MDPVSLVAATAMPAITSSAGAALKNVVGIGPSTPSGMPNTYGDQAMYDGGAPVYNIAPIGVNLGSILQPWTSVPDTAGGLGFSPDFSDLENHGGAGGAVTLSVKGGAGQNSVMILAACAALVGIVMFRKGH